MPAKDGLERTATFFNCLRLLESNTAVLYKSIADRVTVAPARAILRTIGADNQEHALALRGLRDWVKGFKPGCDECDRDFGDIFSLKYRIYEDIIKREVIPLTELPLLIDRLDGLERLFQQKYAFVQSKTLRIFSKAMGVHTLGMFRLKSFFGEVTQHQESHLKLLCHIKDIAAQCYEGDLQMISCLPHEISQVVLPHN